MKKSAEREAERTFFSYVYKQKKRKNRDAYSSIWFMMCLSFDDRSLQPANRRMDVDCWTNNNDR
jgi:hypothetical protein